MSNSVVLLSWLYIVCGGAYLIRYFPNIYDDYDLWQYDGAKEYIIFVLIVLFWLPYAIITTIVGWTVDATYNMIKWFILSGQVDKDGFEKEEFE